MTVYSPSSTTTWKRCPVLWQLTQQGVVRRELGKRELAAALGAAFAQAMHVYHRLRQAGLAIGDAPLGAALGWWLAQQEAWIQEGRRIGSSDEAQYASVTPRLERLVEYACTHDPLPPDWRPLEVEQSLGPDYGNARPDLVCQKGDGALVVVDYKTTLTLGTRVDERKRKLAYRIDDWRDGDQFWHYAWAVGERHAFLDVDAQTWHPRTVAHVAIVLAEVEPKPQLTLHDFWLDPEQVTAWVERQRMAWSQMTLHKWEPHMAWRAAVHTDQFGRCEMYDWCYGPAVGRDVEYTTRTRGL